ncbi:E3 ubiquitin-protein ligase Topors [Ceratina calcarata]|uniref:E3 ubiquitin-protein ligase Topors n=1 Tax=Ceratina calcarata TaxID=156304 RepID=A0AAJ7J5S0_9HYME|nr:E3 ubiquitin-protein ligase Topors [Ceratina calcarata]
MEGPLEIKDSAVVAEEPIKSEAPVPNPESSDRSDGAVSPPPNCSICLGKLVNTSFTDSCLHQFCFTCLLQWSKIKTECPLCKQTFKSIIHNVRSEEDYDQYHVDRELARLDLSYDLGHGTETATSHRFRYRTTVTGYPRRYPHVMPVVLNPEQVARREQLPSIAPQVSMAERLLRRASPGAYRRTIYRLGIWASPLPDAFGSFRECSVDIYRREPEELSRLIPWLNRELQVLLNNNSAYVAYALTVILEYLVQYDIRSQEFRDLLRPHLGEFTDHFVYELLNFARSNFDLVGYDQSVTYVPQGLSNEYVSNVLSPTSSSSSFGSDDPDIRVVDEAIDLRMNTEIPSVGPHTINLPGPSTVSQTFQLNVTRIAVPDVLTISSDFSSSDNDCEVIGYVKPRHERTPEIIELVSSDPEEIDISHIPNDTIEVLSSSLHEDDIQPSTSNHNSSGIKKRVSISSSSESDSDSDSDYVCKKSRAAYGSRSRKRAKRMSTRRRNGSMETRIRIRTTRNVSSSRENDLRKRGSKRNTQRAAKRRSSSSSSTSSTISTTTTTTTSSDSDSEAKHVNEKKSKGSRYSKRTSAKGRSHKDSIKKEARYSDISLTNVSSSESDEIGKNVKQSRIMRRSERRYLTSSSDLDTVRQERVTCTGTKAKKQQVSDTKDSSFYRSASRSSSASSYASQKDKKVNSRRRAPQRDASNDNELDKSNWPSKDVSRKDHESKYKTKNITWSSSEDDFRSRSQCSNYSSKSYTYKKKSKHKDKRKSKKRKRSTSRSRGSSNKSRSTRRHPG